MALRKIRAAFTLIELMVAVGVIAVLAIAATAAINPSEILNQGRDSNRVSNLSALNIALAGYASTGGNLGASTTVYVSIPDPTATSTAGDQCQGVSGLPALSYTGGWVYHCAASSSFRNIDGTGWIPASLTSTPTGKSLGTLPVDPVNQPSSNLYYVYITDGTGYALTAAFQSQKYLKQYLLTTNLDPARYAAGTNLNLIAQEEGLYGYWSFDEGKGSSTTDWSPNSFTGVWYGAAGNNGSYYTTGKVGPYAGYFEAAGDDFVDLGGINPEIADDGNFTIMAWVQPAGFPSSTGEYLFTRNNNNGPASYGLYISPSSSGIMAFPQYYLAGAGIALAPTIGQWMHMTEVKSGSVIWYYYNGLPVASSTLGGGLSNWTWNPNDFRIGDQNAGNCLAYGCMYYPFYGAIDDVRMYNRALSATEILGIYNAEK